MTVEQAGRINFGIDIGGNPEILAAHFHPARARSLGLVQVLIHGNTYDHRYWDAGVINGQNYSYCNYMAERGYDILAIDLPGSGQSSKPHGDSVDLESVSTAIDKAVESMRGHDGPLRGAAGKVALVGHSLGAVVAVDIQTRSQCADFVVVTGTGFGPTGGTATFGPGVREEAMRNDYIALPPSERARVFYHPPTADPEVVQFDNRILRGQMPRRLWMDALAARQRNSVSGVPDLECPVYVQLGEFDPVLPGSLAGAERLAYGADAEVAVSRLEDIGHCFNLHRNREIGWHEIDRFLRG